MTEDTTRSIMERLHAQDVELARLRRNLKARPRRGKWGRLLAGLAVALLVALVPMGILAATPFLDLDPLQDAGHNPNIDLIYNAGITQGCSPTEYCPKEAVTREQMASFLARTAGLGTNPPVVNAKTAQTATNSTQLGGRTGSQIVRAARNSDASAADTVSINASSVLVAVPVAGAAITVPGPGYVLVSASGTFRFNVGCANCTMRLQLANAPALDYTVNTDGASIPVSRTWLVRVTEAGDVNVPLLVGMTRPGAGVAVPSGTFEKPTITALYVPFGTLNNGGPPEIITNP